MSMHRNELQRTVPVEGIFDWNSESMLQTVKDTVGRNLTTHEFQLLLQTGKSTGLNPLTGEIYAVKHDKKPAYIMIARNGYRKSAQRNPDYEYHRGDAVHENDDFQVVDGVVIHNWKLKDRGALVGAFCSVKRKGAAKESYVFVEMSEYNRNFSLWKKDEKPSTMIKKVAEAQALRMSFIEMYTNTYNEFEQWEDTTPKSGMKSLREKLDLEVTEAEVVEEKPLVTEFKDLVKKTRHSQNAINLWLRSAKVKTVDELPDAILQNCITFLKSKLEGAKNEI